MEGILKVTPEKLIQASGTFATTEHSRESGREKRPERF